jgi:hypothetical protein
MALAASDLGPGASVQSEGFKRAPSPVVSEYDRVFRPGVRLGGRSLLLAESLVYDFGDVGTSTLDFDANRHELNTPAGRRAFAKRVTTTLARANGLSVTSLGVTTPVSMAIAQDAFRLNIRLRLKKGSRTARIEIAYAVLRVDRAEGILALGSYPGKRIPAATVTLGARKVAGHFKLAFTVRNLTPPTIAGTPKQGQTLTANPGTWGGAPSGFTYQWQRCDAAGANCAAIPGAITQTYVLGTADAGARIAVAVTAANSVTSVTLGAPATAPIG